jgi:hypothetical protein
VPPRRRRRLFRRLIWWLGVPVALVLLAPHVVAFDFVRTRIESELSAQLGAPCHIGRLGFSWFTGVAVRDLRIDNPEGFSRERPALQLRRAAGDFGLWSLWRGNFVLTGELDGCEVFVEQRADGTTNFEAIGGAHEVHTGGGSDGGGPGGPESDDVRSLLARLRLDLQVRDARIEIRRDGQMLEAMRGLTCTVRKELGASQLHLDFDAQLAPLQSGGADGRLGTKLQCDLDTKTVDGVLTASGVVLQRYAPLLQSLAPGQLTQCEGTVNGTVRIRGGAAGVQLGGELVVAAPRFAGPALRGMTIHGERWSLTPELSAQFAGDRTDCDLSRCALDLGWLRLRGAPSPAGAPAGTMRLHGELDVAAMAAFGGPMPTWLRDGGSKLALDVDVPAAVLRGEFDLQALLGQLAATARFDASELRAHGFTARGLALTGSLRDGALALQLGDGASLDGGALSLSLAAPLTREAPAQLQLRWRNGEVRGPVTAGLRYVVPLFAGLDADTAALQGRLDFGASLQGPLRPRANETWLQWLDRWAGDGDIALRQVAFAPASQLRTLLQPVGAAFGPAATLGRTTNGKPLLAIDELKTPFRFAAGAITLQATQWLAQGKRIGLSGSTRLDGTLDFGFDVSDLLRGHRDGDRVLKALGGSLPPASLRGTVNAPALALPDLQGVLERVLKNEVLEQGAGLLQRELEKLLRKQPK